MISSVMLKQLDGVNREINAIPYDEVQGKGEGVDDWFDSPEVGESWVCRDYVLAKAEKLEFLGWPKAALRVLLCYVETGDYHAVLVVSVDGEAWVLDSRQDLAYSMLNPPPGYRWDRIQVVGTNEFEPVSNAELA